MFEVRSRCTARAARRKIRRKGQKTSARRAEIAAAGSDPLPEAAHRARAASCDADRRDGGARQHEGRGQADAVGQEAGAHDAQHGGHHAQTRVERQHAAQHAGGETVLHDGDERGFEDAARDAGEDLEQREEGECGGRQKSRHEERSPHRDVHGLYEQHFVDAVVAQAHQQAPGERAAAPHDLDEAHFADPAAEVAERHERKEHAHRHDEEEHEDRRAEELRHAPGVADGRGALAHFAQQGGALRAAAQRIGYAHESQRSAGDQCACDVEQQDVAQLGEGQQQCAQRGSGDGRGRFERLIDAGDARELCRRGQQGHGGLHGGGVESRADRAAGEQRVDVPQLRGAEAEEQRQGQRAEGDESVGQDHRALAVPAVDPHARHEAQQRLGQHAGEGGEREGLGRSGFETQVEDHGIAYDGAAQDGYSLSGPDDREYLFPVFAVFHVVFRSRGTKI